MSRTRETLAKLAPFLALAYVIYLYAAAHSLKPGVYDRESYFHARFAQQMPAHFLERTFPWTQASVWKDHFCDKEFLYHVLLIPFTRNAAEPITGALYCSLLLVAAVFSSVYFLLRKSNVPLAWVFALAMLCMGGDFLVRLECVRAHVLSIVLAVIGLQLFISRSWRWLIALGFVYAWSYSVPFILIFIGAPFVFGRWLAGGGLDWRSVCAALGGVIAGLVIHPYSPHTLDTFIVIVKEITSSAHGGPSFELGSEMTAYSARDLLFFHPLYFVTLAGVLITGWRLRSRRSPELLGLLILTVFWSLLSVKFARSFEYAVPVLAVTLGFTIRDALQQVDLAALFQNPVPGRVAAGMALAVVLLATGHVLSAMFWYDTKSEAHAPHFRAALEWLRPRTQPGETIVNLWWHDFPDLYYDGVDRTYVWGMDPHFTLLYDKEQADLLEGMRSQRLKVDGALLAKMFNARYMVIQNQSQELDLPGLREGIWRPVRVYEHALVYALTGPDGPPPTIPATPSKKEGPGNP